MRIRTTNKPGISALIDECTRHGMKHVVCSPGSRNAPLVIAIDQHPDIETIVIHDERSAAFYALGMAQALSAPVGLVCTSGSALLNYYPAVAEAYYQEIPLVVLSADRPAEWVDHGDGQTIVQKGVYANHIRYQMTVSEHKCSEEDVSIAFNAALNKWVGPIHFNVPLTEPLYEIEEHDWEKKSSIDHLSADFELTEEERIPFREAWISSPKKMILCGQMDFSSSLKNDLEELSNDSSIAVLVENTSNLNGKHWVHCLDRTLAGITEEEIEAFQPDLLITIGGAIISKRIKQFLRASDIKFHWRIGYSFPEMDTYRALTNHFSAKPGQFLREILKNDFPRNESRFGSVWKQRDFMIQENQKDFLTAVEYSDFAVFETLLDYLPEGCNVHMANSSVVRYCQLFDPITSLRYFSNRGASGIDGSTSTAAGISLIDSGKCNVLFTGDISFFYDSNALWNANLPANLRIFLINNEGGGIFRIIDGPRKSEQLEKYFEAHHTQKAEFICKAHEVEYLKAHSIAEIERGLHNFFEEDDRPKLMEIFTPRERNDEVLKAFFAAAASM